MKAGQSQLDFAMALIMYLLEALASEWIGTASFSSNLIGNGDASSAKRSPSIALRVLRPPSISRFTVSVPHGNDELGCDPRALLILLSEISTLRQGSTSTNCT